MVCMAGCGAHNLFNLLGEGLPHESRHPISVQGDDGVLQDLIYIQLLLSAITATKCIQTEWFTIAS